MENFILSLVEFFKQFSYFGVVLSLTFEFVPAELVLPLVGYWVYQGDMNLYLAIFAGTVGGTCGPLTLYYLGKLGGRPMVLKYGKYFFVKDKHIIAADRFFEKYGGWMALFGRFVPVVRTSISLPCGMAKMNVWVFSIYTFIGVLPMTTLYVYLGYKLGPKWKDVGNLVEPYLVPVGITLLIGAVLYFILKKMRSSNNRNKKTNK